MKPFKDRLNREWKIVVNVATLRRVRDQAKVDLLQIVEGKLIDRLIHDPILLCDVVYEVCRPEAESLGVSPEDFGAAMAGDAIDSATQALLEELADFFPSPKDRANLRRVLAATRQAIERMQSLVTERLDSGVLDERIAQLLATASASFGSAPASSDSTQPP